MNPNGRKFGYSISSDRQIDYDANNHSLTRMIRTYEPTLDICIGCGTCTATCTAHDLVPFNIRKVHTFIRRSETKGLLRELEKCMLCGKCQLACPRGVNLRNLILVIQQTLVHTHRL